MHFAKDFVSEYFYFQRIVFKMGFKVRDGKKLDQRTRYENQYPLRNLRSFLRNFRSENYSKMIEFPAYLL